MVEASQPSAKSIAVKLGLISFISLFCELMIIRWLSTEVRMFAYFKNLPLIACFLGLGLGLLLSHRKYDWFRWSNLVLLYLSGILILATGLQITHLSFLPPDPNLMMFSNTEPWTLGIGIKAVVAMFSIFALIIILFVGLGQETGKYFEKLSPLKAYSVNVLGGLLGVGVYSFLSFLGTDPGIWLVVLGVTWFLTYRKIPSLVLICLGIAYSLFLGSFIAKSGYGSVYELTRWSPYYRIDVITIKNKQGLPITHDLFINYDGFQSMLECRPEVIAQQEPKMAKGLAGLCRFYANPFVVYGKPADKVLILGSGSGTDVAAALRYGAKHVDAVEIDPMIVELGKQMHPEKPYSSDRVKVYVEDARTFLKTCADRYDIIVLPSLDSHTAFSTMSSLRTDNYIFTRESMNECAKLLAPQGILCTRFVCVPDWLWDRHYELVRGASSNTPVGFYQGGYLREGFIVSGPGIKDRQINSLGEGWVPRQYHGSDMPVPSDDWPFLFLPARKIPPMYAVPLIVAILGVLIVGLRQKRMQHLTPYNMAMFGLGAGFMLLEVRTMAALSLLFGSTWLVNSIVIGAVMICILIANWVAARISEKRIALVLLAILMAAIVVSTFVNPNSLSAMGPQLGALIGCLIFLAPVVFSSATFSLLFKYSSSENSTQALAFNLVGGVLGICLEYISMITGIRALGFVALLIYSLVLALVSGAISKSKVI